MPRKARPPSREDQARLSKQYSEDLAEYRRQLKELEKERRAERRQLEKDARGILKEASRVGLYSPKSLELTPYRKRKARELKRNFGEYLDRNEFFFLPANKEAKRRILERAQQLQIPTSRTGLFYPKGDYKNARLRKSKKRDEYEIVRTGKVKKGPNRGKVYTDLTPLPSADELTSQRERLREMGKSLGPLKQGEVLAFEVHENGHDGYSRRTYSSDDIERAIDALIHDLDEGVSGQKQVPAQIHFFRHITIVKTTSKSWRELHPPKAPRRIGRVRRSGGKFDTRGSKG